MLFKNAQCLWYGILPLAFLTVICSAYAYSVNARRADNDPQKRDFHVLAILLAPITFPLYALVGAVTFLVLTFLFGIILVLFVAALVLAREPFILQWLRRKALALGNRLLELNTALIRLFWNPGAAQRTQKSPSTFDSLAGRFV